MVAQLVGVVDRRLGTPLGDLAKGSAVVRLGARQRSQDGQRPLLAVEEVVVGVSVDDIGDDASLISDLNLDSIQMLSLITGLESEFNIMLDEEDLDLENLSSVNKLAEFVQKKLAQPV